MNENKESNENEEEIQPTPDPFSILNEMLRDESKEIPSTDRISDEELSCLLKLLWDGTKKGSEEEVKQRDPKTNESLFQAFKEELSDIIREDTNDSIPKPNVMKDEVITEIHEVIKRCESILRKRRLAGIIKYEKPRSIYPSDLPFLSKHDYVKVVRLISEGNAVFNLEKKPVDYLSACRLLDEVMPSHMNLDLVNQFSEFLLRPPAMSFDILQFDKDVNVTKLGQKYYFKGLRLRNIQLGMPYFIASAYYQYPVAKKRILAILRSLRFKALLAPETDETNLMISHWKMERLKANSQLTGLGFSLDEKSAISIYKKLAEEGHASCQFAIGMCYCNGIGVVQNEKTAYRWIKKAAEQGHRAATYELAFCYLYGRGITQNYKKMFKILEPFVEEREEFACFIASLCYSWGVGVIQDKELGQELYQFGQGYVIEELGSKLRLSLMEMIQS